MGLNFHRYSYQQPLGVRGQLVLEEGLVCCALQASATSLGLITLDPQPGTHPMLSFMFCCHRLEMLNDI